MLLDERDTVSATNTGELVGLVEWKSEEGLKLRSLHTKAKLRLKKVPPHW